MDPVLSAAQGGSASMRSRGHSRRLFVRRMVRVVRAGVGLAVMLAALLQAGAAIAAPLSQLQVLLPGESAAPGTASGKTGTPRPQTAGIPFLVTVNACDASWAVVSTVTHT